MDDDDDDNTPSKFPVLKSPGNKIDKYFFSFGLISLECCGQSEKHSTIVN